MKLFARSNGTRRWNACAPKKLKTRDEIRVFAATVFYRARVWAANFLATRALTPVAASASPRRNNFAQMTAYRSHGRPESIKNERIRAG
jgi:hypothetical protein